MNIQSIIEQDPRIKELRKQYQTLINKKNFLIMELSQIEADTIKASGVYETIANEIVEAIKKSMGQATATPEPVVPTEPIEAQVAEENKDEGFADASEPSVAEPSAETARPADQTEE